jgi:hypothetical protein
LSKDPISSDDLTVAELCSSLGEVEAGASLSPGRLAAYLDGGLTEDAVTQVQHVLGSSRGEFLDALAGIEALENLSLEAAPSGVIAAALDRVPSNVTALRPRVPVETFMLLAASSEPDSKAVLCRSQSGIWTLEIFVTPENPEKGYLLLSVHPDHRETYEGRRARVFTETGNEERVLAEELVQNGEVYASVSLANLDLHSRDAINVTFGPILP